MVIGINVTWKAVGTGAGGNTATGTGTGFDTEAKQVVTFYKVVNLSLLDPVPADVHAAAGSVLYYECPETAGDYTATIWRYDGAGGTTSETQPNSPYCGYFGPPDPPPDPMLTCALTLGYALTPTATGADLVATAAGAHGAVAYALDGGPAQGSPAFAGLAPGPHQLTATDDGLAGCVRTADFTVASPAPAPLTRPARADFVLQPLWYPAQAVPGARVLLELHAESRHQAGDFALVLRLRRRADAAGQVAFRLDTLLAALLAPFVPPAVATETLVSRTPLLNYYIRVATLDPATGVPSAYEQGPVCTAVRGALPAEHRALDYFAYRLAVPGGVPFLTWQPAGKRLTPAQPEWLLWLCPAAVPPAVVVQRRYIGASGLVTTEAEPVAWAPADGPTGPLLAVPVRPRAGAAFVEVQLCTAAGAPLSASVRYAVVAATARSRYLLFANSLGGLDTLRTEGRREATLEVAVDQAERPVQLGDAAPAPEELTFGVNGQRKIKLATGWLPPAELAWLQELVLSRDVWELRAGRLLPLTLAKRQLLYESDEAALRGVTLELDYAFAPTAYANLP